MKRAGIVIVTWNSEDHIDACLNAAVERADEVVVVDNASSDGTVERVRRHNKVRLIANRRNRGFAAAANQGASSLESDFVLLVNPDVTLETDIEPLTRACMESGIAAATGRLLNEDGSLQEGFFARRLPTALTLAFEAMGWNRIWPGNPVNRRYRYLYAEWETEVDVEQPAAALLMFRLDRWRELRGFDEGFQPLWFEDVDLLRRAADRGYRIRYVPTVEARHHGGHTAEQLSFRCRTLYWYDSLLRYASKHFGRSGRVMVSASVVFGSLARAPFSVFQERSGEPLRVYLVVMSRALDSLWRGTRRLNVRQDPAGARVDRETLRTPE